MTAPLSNPLLSQAAGELAADARALDSLKREAQRDPQGAVKKAAQQFEALFMQMVLKSMREAMPKSGLLGSSGEDMYTGMLDQQLAAKVAEGGTGLADVIARQLTRHMRAPAEAPAAGAAAAPAAALPAQDRYAELARPRAQAVSRYAELARTSATEAARAAYLERRSPQAVASAPEAAPASDSVTQAGQRQFLAQHWDSAQQASRLTGVPATHILSQAALESGWGQGEIRDASGAPSYNLFGIKASPGWQGRTVEVMTTEVDNGVARRVLQKFRAYADYGEAFRDWAQLMTANPRYSEVLARGRDALGFAFGLQRAGYATDPRYGEKLSAVIAGVMAALRRS